MVSGQPGPVKTPEESRGHAQNALSIFIHVDKGMSKSAMAKAQVPTVEEENMQEKDEDGTKAYRFPIQPEPRFQRHSKENPPARHQLPKQKFCDERRYLKR